MYYKQLSVIIIHSYFLNIENAEEFAIILKAYQIKYTK